MKDTYKPMTEAELVEMLTNLPDNMKEIALNQLLGMCIMAQSIEARQSA